MKKSDETRLTEKKEKKKGERGKGADVAFIFKSGL